MTDRVATHPVEPPAAVPGVAHVMPLQAGTVAAIVSFILFCLGSILNVAAYDSLGPLFLALLVFMAGISFVSLPGIGGPSERYIFLRVFLVAWVAAGVAAIYAEVLGDPAQLGSDAGGFFDLASGQASGLTLENLRVVNEGGLAIILWRAVYDFSASVGFGRGRFVGILVNVLALAASGVLAAKISRRVYGDDSYRLRRLTLLFSGCGLFWLFAGIHLRDAVVLLTITAIIHAWVLFLAAPGRTARLLVMLAASLVGGTFLGFLRGEFAFVPIALAAAGTAALMMGKGSDSRRLGLYALISVGLIGSAVLLARFWAELQFVLSLGSGYAELAAEHHGGDSLGMSLIVNQPLPLRIILGSIYLYVFPIPFWAGLTSNSAYDVFKSLNAVFFYIVIPLVVLGIWQLTRETASRSSAIMFLVFVAGGFTVAIAVTSLETRHLGAFLPAVFLLALGPDLRDRTTRRQYRTLLAAMLAGVALVHAAWGILKLL